MPSILRVTRDSAQARDGVQLVLVVIYSFVQKSSVRRDIPYSWQHIDETLVNWAK